MADSFLIDIGGGNVSSGKNFLAERYRQTRSSKSLAEKPEYVNLDSTHGEGDWKRQAQDAPWPADDDSAYFLLASHVMEHIPAGEPRIAVMNEAHRVLKKSGEFTIALPILTGSWHAIADPTHVSYWIPESFRYFDGTIEPCADYGILRWQTIFFNIRSGWEATWVGRPLKDEPPSTPGTYSVGAQMSQAVWNAGQLDPVGPQYSADI